MTKKQEDWEAILSTNDLPLEDRVSPVFSSDDIKKATGGREPRLVCSMDSRKSVPEILRKQGLFVLPVQNGKYRLVKGKGYQHLPAIERPPKKWKHQIGFELTTRHGGSGEDPHLLHAYNTGLLSKFTDIDELYQTTAGRRYSTEFEFCVGDSRPLRVNSVQFQVDGLFEGPDDIVVVEAKAGSRDDFITRQLYYPYRHYRKEANKSIRTIFFIYDEDEETYSLWEYGFSDPYDYASIELQEAQRFRITPTEHRLDEF